MILSAAVRREESDVEDAGSLSGSLSDRAHLVSTSSNLHQNSGYLPYLCQVEGQLKNRITKREPSAWHSLVSENGQKEE